ncbi:hypothetical protein [uncultured Desulfovibrio sp.]|uniref:hypothetical protein n=1 Tax=uncultured Desulfovibrio sp. TaxID=167968 RepID=UPI002586E152|nr:hypothetical protein [uncultured Desulfovibrio sp.]
MAALFDPLVKLTSLGAYVRIVIDANGSKKIQLTYERYCRADDVKKAQGIASRFERLILLQCDVPPGWRPRTVQQLVAMGKIGVVAGRYILKNK